MSLPKSIEQQYPIDFEVIEKNYPNYTHEAMRILQIRNENILHGYSLAVQERQWIPVTPDTMPEFDTWVLCYCRIYGFYIGCHQRILDTNYGNWNDGKDLGILPPIFWMLLPEKPNN